LAWLYLENFVAIIISPVFARRKYFLLLYHAKELETFTILFCRQNAQTESVLFVRSEEKTAKKQFCVEFNIGISYIM